MGLPLHDAQFYDGVKHGENFVGEQIVRIHQPADSTTYRRWIMWILIILGLLAWLIIAGHWLVLLVLLAIGIGILALIWNGGGW